MRRADSPTTGQQDNPERTPFDCIRPRPVLSANNQRRPNVSVGRKNRTYIAEMVFLFRLVTITGTGRIYSPVRSIHHRTSGTPRFIGVSGTFQVQPAEHAEPSNDHDGYTEFD